MVVGAVVLVPVGVGVRVDVAVGVAVLVPVGVGVGVLVGVAVGEPGVPRLKARAVHFVVMGVAATGLLSGAVGATAFCLSW